MYVFDMLFKTRLTCICTRFLLVNIASFSFQALQLQFSWLLWVKIASLLISMENIILFLLLKNLSIDNVNSQFDTSYRNYISEQPRS